MFILGAFLGHQDFVSFFILISEAMLNIFHRYSNFNRDACGQPQISHIPINLLLLICTICVHILRKTRGFKRSYVACSFVLFYVCVWASIIYVEKLMRLEWNFQNV